MWNQLPEEEDLTEERREMRSEDPAFAWAKDVLLQ